MYWLIRIVISLFFIPAFLFGTVYYIDATDGSNGNTGLSPAQAWQTIAYLQTQTLSAGDSVLFQKNEVWREMYTAQYSGTSGNPIFHGTYDSGADPIIRCSELGVGWVNVSGDKWYITGISIDPRFCAFDGIVGFDTTASTYVDEEGEWFWTTAGIDTLFIYAANINNIEYGARYSGVFDNNNNYLIFSGLRVDYCRGVNFDIDGDNNIIDGCVSYGTRSQGIDIDGNNATVSNSTIRAFEYRTSAFGISAIGVTGVIITNNIINSDLSGFSTTVSNLLGVNISNTSDLDVNNNTIDHWQISIQINNTGTASSGTVNNNTIDSCDIGDADESDGIKVSGTDDHYPDLILTENTITGFNEDGIDLFDTDSVVVTENDISNPLSGGNATGIKAGGNDIKANFIKWNFIHDLSSGGLDNGIVHHSPHDSICYNVIANINGNAINSQGADSANVLNNTIFNATGYGIRGLSSVVDLNVVNNICDGAGGDISLGVGSSAGGGNNILVNDAAAVGGTYTGTNDKGTTDPLFADAANNDFTLRVGSPAIDGGTDWGQVRDKDDNAVPFGSAPDIGAYEFIPKRSTLVSLTKLTVL